MEPTKTQQIETLQAQVYKYKTILRITFVVLYVYGIFVFLLYFLGFISDPIVRLGCPQKNDVPLPVIKEDWRK